MNCKWNEGDRVHSCRKNITGTVVDLFQGLDDRIYCTIENDDNTPSDDPDAWNLNGIVLVNCPEDDLEEIPITGGKSHGF